MHRLISKPRYPLGPALSKGPFFIPRLHFGVSPLDTFPHSPPWDLNTPAHHHVHVYFAQTFSSAQRTSFYFWTCLSFSLFCNFLTSGDTALFISAALGPSTMFCVEQLMALHELPYPVLWMWRVPQGSLTGGTDLSAVTLP